MLVIENAGKNRGQGGTVAEAKVGLGWKAGDCSLDVELAKLVEGWKSADNGV